jgi:hypothetical protein
MKLRNSQPISLEAIMRLPERTGVFMVYGRKMVFCGAGYLRAGMLHFWNNCSPAKLHNPTHFAYFECSANELAAKQNEVISQYRPVTQTVTTDASRVLSGFLTLRGDWLSA